MIRYDETNNVLVMDLVDLEHCGFCHDEFLAELFFGGLVDIDDKPLCQGDPRFPKTFIVNVGGGHVLLEGHTTEAKLAEYRKRRGEFEKWLAQIGIKPNSCQEE